MEPRRRPRRQLTPGPTRSLRLPARTAAALLAISLTAAACAGTGTAELADGDQTVDEATGAVDDDGGAATDTEPAADAGDTADATDADAAEEAAASGDESGDDGPSQAATPVASLWWTADTVQDGATFTAADLSGGNVVLWMWAPWCSVCNREAPEVAQALADLPDDVTIVGVAGRDDVGPMQEFIAEHGLQDMTHVVDADGAVWASYGISYQPAWVFIDAEGEASVAAGALGYDGIFNGIDEVFGT